MNKQELIERMEGLKNLFGNKPEYVETDTVIKLISELDEPEKIKVPPIVSVWYQINKDNLYKNIAYLCANWVKSTTDDTLFNWMSNTDNFIQILVNMHQFGYEVEKEKRYRVKMKGIEGHNSYLKYNKNLKHWYFGSLFIYNNDVDTRTYHTRKELEDAGFSEVFDSPLFEVEEVTE